MTAVRYYVRAGALWLALIAALLLGLAYYLGYQDGIDERPSCPSEDSCTVDYRGGAWHIEPEADVAVPVAGTPDYVG